MTRTNANAIPRKRMGGPYFAAKFLPRLSPPPARHPEACSFVGRKEERGRTNGLIDRQHGGAC
eukprot:scaffold135491_cov33-Tisochrysis_lutea.AAC.4